MRQTIAIVSGTGAAGFGLAARFARAGARVLVGSRDAQKAADTARRIGAEGRLNADAVAEADIVVLAVPLAAQISTLKSLHSSFRPSAVLVDATVPLEAAIGGRVAHALTLWAGSAAQQAARHTPPGVSVVAAFHTLSAELLAQLDRHRTIETVTGRDELLELAARRIWSQMIDGSERSFEHRG